MSKIISILSRIHQYRYIIVLVIAFVFIGLVGENSYLAHLRHQNTINELREEIARYQKQYKEDTEKLYELNTDIEAIKRVAREKYFMKAADEDVFIIVE